ncbi:MAG: YbaK/EbsC family protein [Candidatus Gracilibacteria bacterium]
MKHKVFEILDDLNINYTNYEHQPVHSVLDCKGIDIPGQRVKSLLIRNKKGTNFYMVVLGEDKKLETNKIREIFDDSKMSFLEEELMMEKICLKPGSVSPFALINNKDKDIKVVFEKNLKGALIGFHPLQNDNTVVLQMDDVERFLKNLGFEFVYGDL